MFAKLTAYLKAIVAFAGSALLVWNEYSPGFIGLLPVSWSHGISVVIGLLTFVATFAVPNLTNDPAVAAAQSVVLRTGRHAKPE